MNNYVTNGQSNHVTNGQSNPAYVADERVRIYSQQNT